MHCGISSSRSPHRPEPSGGTNSPSQLAARHGVASGRPGNRKDGGCSATLRPRWAVPTQGGESPGGGGGSLKPVKKARVGGMAAAPASGRMRGGTPRGRGSSAGARASGAVLTAGAQATFCTVFRARSSGRRRSARGARGAPSLDRPPCCSSPGGDRTVTQVLPAAPGLFPPPGRSVCGLF